MDCSIVAMVALSACGGANGAADGAAPDSALDGRAHSDSSVDAAGGGDSPTTEDSCAPLDADSGPEWEGGHFPSCDASPCGPSQFCVNWVNGSLGGPQPYAVCASVPTPCVPTTCNPTTTCVCVEVWGGMEACFSPQSCVEDAGAIVVTCEIPPHPGK
jgi:hypothetical protein